MSKDYVVLQVEGISIVGQMFLPEGKLPLATVCLCHGAPSGGPPEPGDGGYPELAERFCREGYRVFFFNFRGAGESGGNIDFLGWTRDLEAVVAYLTDGETCGLYLVANSAGAAVSICVAANEKRVAGVAACACPAHFELFTSADPQSIIDRYREIGAIRDDGFPLSLEGWFEGLRQVTPVDHVAGIAPRPLLLVHGSEDATVPVEHARELYQRAGNPKQLVIIEGAGHRLRRDERAVGAVLEWLRSVRPGGA